MKERDSRLIDGMLRTDFYPLMMGQLYFRKTGADCPSCSAAPWRGLPLPGEMAWFCPPRRAK